MNKVMHLFSNCLFSAFSGSQFMGNFLFQDVVQQNSTLIEEMLHLIIMVVGECRLFWKQTIDLDRAFYLCIFVIIHRQKGMCA